MLVSVGQRAFPMCYSSAQPAQIKNVSVSVSFKLRFL